jgi:hypothetical protein
LGNQQRSRAMTRTDVATVQATEKGRCAVAVRGSAKGKGVLFSGRQSQTAARGERDGLQQRAGKTARAQGWEWLSRGAAHSNMAHAARHRRHAAA